MTNDHVRRFFLSISALFPSGSFFLSGAADRQQGEPPLLSGQPSLVRTAALRGGQPLPSEQRLRGAGSHGQRTDDGGDDGADGVDDDPPVVVRDLAHNGISFKKMRQSVFF